jgi:hypothetical protein
MKNPHKRYRHKLEEALDAYHATTTGTLPNQLHQVASHSYSVGRVAVYCPGKLQRPAGLGFHQREHVPDCLVIIQYRLLFGGQRSLLRLS